ncbi:hypothetical protein GA0115253_105657, partial [Streptomyces sp. Termitarium-T10T-6]
MAKVVKKPSWALTALRSRTASSSTSSRALSAAARAPASVGTVAVSDPSSGRLTAVPSASSATAIRPGTVRSSGAG